MKQSSFLQCGGMDCFAALAKTLKDFRAIPFARPHPSILRNSAFATFSSVERGISSTK